VFPTAVSIENNQPFSFKVKINNEHMYNYNTFTSYCSPFLTVLCQVYL
jgi:hypothetical protein